jgi:hypothetical protein
MPSIACSGEAAVAAVNYRAQLFEEIREAGFVLTEVTAVHGAAAD